jgi:hypothetical protein
MAGKDEAADEDEVEKLKMDLAAADEDEVEKLKMDLAAAEKRALALFIAMQQARLEISILKGEKGITKDVDDLDDDGNVRALTDFREERRRRMNSVDVPTLRCFACNDKVNAYRATLHRSCYGKHRYPDRVFCRKAPCTGIIKYREDFPLPPVGPFRVHKTRIETGAPVEIIYMTRNPAEVTAQQGVPGPYGRQGGSA